MRLWPKRVAPSLVSSLWTVIKVFAGLLKAKHGPRPDQRSKLTQSFHASIALRSLSAARLLFVDEKRAVIKAALLFQTQVKTTNIGAAHLKSLLRHLLHCYMSLRLTKIFIRAGRTAQSHRGPHDKRTHLEKQAGRCCVWNVSDSSVQWL